MKYRISITMALIFTIMNCGNSKKESSMNEKNQNLTETKENDLEQIDVAIISTEFGDMVVEFFDDVAPNHVESFKLHAKSGYYDGTIFHRVIPGFMIQGGDPNTKGENKASYGMGGHAAKYFGIGNESEPKTWTIPAEFNNKTHTRGVLSMARANNPNSGGSQFFICAASAPHLDGQYTVFGQVIQGDKIIEQIVNLPRDARDNPNKRIEMKVNLDTRTK
tara:strand:+ start:2135 stop:2794 length:660 start_codon:yes stop_codon:yes gene_type:complete